MVTPTYGTAVFKGLQTGQTYAVDFYVSDVVGAPVQWDNGTGAGASSGPFWKAPENVALVDLSIATGPTVMVGLIPTSDGFPIGGQRFRIANFLNTLATRASLSLGFRQAKNIGMIQY